MKSWIVVLAISFFAITSFVAMEDNPTEILKKGDKITQVAGKTLVGTLQKNLEKGGVPQAVSFCNIAALPMTDSLSKFNGAIIKRTALKYRNPENKPTKLEKKILTDYQATHAAKQPLEPKVIQQKNGEWLYVKPILLQAQCQVCHGEIGKTIAATDYAFIKKLYPKDLATGFKEGDLRGMWVVRMKEMK